MLTFEHKFTVSSTQKPKERTSLGTIVTFALTKHRNRIPLTKHFAKVHSTMTTEEWYSKIKLLCIQHKNFTPTLTTRLIGAFRTASFYGLFSCNIHRSEWNFLKHRISSLNTRLQRHFLAATLYPQSRSYGRFGFYILPMFTLESYIPSYTNQS